MARLSSIHNTKQQKLLVEGRLSTTLTDLPSFGTERQRTELLYVKLPHRFNLLKSNFAIHLDYILVS